MSEQPFDPAQKHRLACCKRICKKMTDDNNTYDSIALWRTPRLLCDRRMITAIITFDNLYSLE